MFDPTTPISSGLFSINIHMRKKFKEFLENYDVYLDKPSGWITPDQSSPAVPINAPETVTQNPQPNKSQGKKKTEKPPVSEDEI